MKIKRRHIKMARAAFRCWKNRQQRRWDAGGARQLRPWRPINRWHRAAKGKHQ